MRSPGSAIFQLYFTDEARHINNGTIAAVSQTSQNPSRPSHPSDHDCRPDHRGFTSHPILLIVAVHGGRPSGLSYPSNPDILLVRRSWLSHDQLYLLQLIHRSQFAGWFHLFFAAHRSDGRGVQPRYDHIFQPIIGKLILAIGRQQLH